CARVVPAPDRTLGAAALPAGGRPHRGRLQAPDVLSRHRDRLRPPHRGASAQGRDRPGPVRRRKPVHGGAEGHHGVAQRRNARRRAVRSGGAVGAGEARCLQGWIARMNKLIPEGFRKLDISDEFVSLIGPLWFKAEGERLRVGLPLEPRHGNPLGWAHGGLLVTVADMVMGAGSGYATCIRWPHPTVSLSTEFVRGARLGHWLEGSARVARRTLNFCFCSWDLICDGEIVLVASGVFKVPDIDKIPEAARATVMGKWE